MKKDSVEIKRYICYGFAGVAFLIGLIRMFIGFFGSGEDPWYDNFIEFLFLSFIAFMILRLSKTFK